MATVVCAKARTGAPLPPRLTGARAGVVLACNTLENAFGPLVSTVDAAEATYLTTVAGQRSIVATACARPVADTRDLSRRSHDQARHRRRGAGHAPGRRRPVPRFGQGQSRHVLDDDPGSADERVTDTRPAVERSPSPGGPRPAQVSGPALPPRSQPRRDRLSRRRRGGGWHATVDLVGSGTARGARGARRSSTVSRAVSPSASTSHPTPARRATVGGPHIWCTSTGTAAARRAAATRSRAGRRRRLRPGARRAR